MKRTTARTAWKWRSMWLERGALREFEYREGNPRRVAHMARQEGYYA